MPDAPSVRPLLAKLSAEEKNLLIRLLEKAREGGMHDTLVYLNDEMSIRDLRFKKGQIELPHQPFDNQLYYDWISRRDGIPWPDEDDGAAG